MHDLSHSFENQSILITGGTGSFGQTMARHLLLTKARRIIIFSRDECKQWQMQQNAIFQDSRLRFFLGDIRDKERLKMAFRNVDAIIHAAALKQVPAAEYNPSEFIKTNVLGTMNVVEAALEERVKKLIFLSTDKATSSINLYGSTKFCAEKLVLASEVYSDPDKPTMMSVVRYGNVMMSRGSVIEHWQNFVANNSSFIPLTHLEMTRFWLTLDQAATFVHQSLEDMQGSEIFIPRLKSMQLKNLAQVIAPKLELKITGIRPGEKIHEILVGSHEAHYAYKQNDRFLILHESMSPSKLQQKKAFWLEKAQAVESDFYFASNHNCEFLTNEQMRDLLSQKSK
jgi:UDP-N-acetylglucosamine 4,6-dehydratase